MHPFWLLRVVSLPTHASACRLRVWWTLKASGCVVLRDGAYLLPNRPRIRKLAQVQAEDVLSSGGNAYVLVLDSENQEQQRTFEGLFDHSAN
jgi:hypothetical protein